MLAITFYWGGVVPKPDVLQARPYPAWDRGSLDADFMLHRRFEACTGNALLRINGNAKRATATRVELGTGRELIAACGKPEMSASGFVLAAITRTLHVNASFG